MAIEFYYSPISPPCITVLLAAKAVGVELNLKPLDLFKEEHLTPEFIKLNPQHTIPTIDDNGFVVWESRAIIIYLQNQYGKDDSLYPKDPKKRAIVDQRLFFSMDLKSRLYQVYNKETIISKKFDPAKLEEVNKSLGFLDTFLGQSEFVAGDKLTLADLPLVVDISNLEVIGHDVSPYKNINRWTAKMTTAAPGYKECIEDNLELVKQVLEKMSKGE